MFASLGLNLDVRALLTPLKSPSNLLIDRFRTFSLPFPPTHLSTNQPEPASTGN